MATKITIWRNFKLYGPIINECRDETAMKNSSWI